MHKKLYDLIFALNIVFQAAFSGIVPSGLLVLAVIFLKNKFQLGDAFLAVGIVLAVLVGVYCMFKYAISASEVLSKQKTKDNNRS